MKMILYFLLLCSSVLSHAADLPRLRGFFKQNYDNFYQPRMCGKNIALLVTEASKLSIDLSNSYVLKVEGAGFLETSGFYTRKAINDRAMLGYFHFVLVADGHVFDFDLAEPLVLPIEDYVRLQFTPPYTPFKIYGVTFDPKTEFKAWSVSRFELGNYLTAYPLKTWSKRMDEYVRVDRVLGKSRLR